MSCWIRIRLPQINSQGQKIFQHIFAYAEKMLHAKMWSVIADNTLFPFVVGAQIDLLLQAAALSLIFEDNLRFHFLPFKINGKIDMGNQAGGLIACVIYPCNP